MIESDARMAVVVGRPGASKTWATQEAIKIPQLEGRASVISLGGVVRGILEGQKSSAYLSQIVEERSKVQTGQCMSDRLIAAVLTEALQNQPTAQELILVDGFPRTESQAAQLRDIADYSGKALVGALVFNISPQTSRDRQYSRSPRSCEHALNETIIHQRLSDYDNRTVPAIDYLGQVENLPLYEIDAEQSKSNTVTDVAQVLQSMVTAAEFRAVPLEKFS